jgi:hypothetical protein
MLKANYSKQTNLKVKRLTISRQHLYHLHYIELMKDGGTYYVYPIQCWVKDGNVGNKSDLVLRKVKFVQYKIISLSPCLNKLVRIEL